MYLTTKRRMALRLATRKAQEQIEDGDAIERALQEQRNLQHRIDQAHEEAKKAMPVSWHPFLRH